MRDNIPAYKRTTHEITLGVSADKTLTSFHIASLACLIEYADRSGLHVNLRKQTAAEEYLADIIQLGEYWATGQDYIEAKFTIGSSLHNSGMGLDNIRSSCTENDKMYLFSNKAYLEADNESVSVNSLNFDFRGTLINFGITLSHLPDKEYIDDFDI